MAVPTTTNLYGKVIPAKAYRETTLKDNKTTGLIYPPQVSPGNGYFSKSSGLGLIKSSLTSLIKTDRGERFMRPDYGCNLRKFLMEPLDETTFSLIKEEIETSVRRYLSSVSIGKIQVFETKSNMINVKLFASVRDAAGSNFGVGVKI